MKHLVAAAIFLLSASAAKAVEDHARYADLGDCIAYFAVNDGIDGKKQVDPKTAAIFSALGSEFMFEASVLKLDDNTAHTYVVDKLIELNGMAKDKGKQAVSAVYSNKCEALSASIVGGN